VSACADDVATFARLGLIGKRVGASAEKFADWCFFFSTLVSLVENGVERQMITSLSAEGEYLSLNRHSVLSICFGSWYLVEGRMYNESMSGASAKSKPQASKLDEKELSRLQKQDYWLQVTRAKLAMDLIFVCEYIAVTFRSGSLP
jgi:hypothetical protein